MTTQENALGQQLRLLVGIGIARKLGAVLESFDAYAGERFFPAYLVDNEFGRRRYMRQRWYFSLISAVFIFTICVAAFAGCAVFRATGRSVEAVGEGAGHAVAGTGRAVESAASETKRDITGR